MKATPRSGFVAMLEQGSASELRRFAQMCFPQNAQPKNDEEAEALYHFARVHSKKVKANFRMYSLRWLQERGLDPQISALSKGVKMDAAPTKIVEAVGIAVVPTNPSKKELAAEKEAVMAKAAEELLLEGRPMREVRREMRVASKTVKEW